MSKNPKQCDLRLFPRPRQPAEAVRAFGRLKVGQAIEITSDADLRGVLFELQEEHPQAFDWSVLEGGPELYRAEVRRRPTRGPGGVLDYLSWDHKRLDGLLATTSKTLDRSGSAEALKVFKEFIIGIERHGDMEEQILFPAFEQVCGLGGNPLAGIYTEHERIHRLCAEVSEALEARHPIDARSRLGTLRELMLLHAMKEERFLYPVSDQLAASDRARTDLIRWMQAI